MLLKNETNNTVMEIKTLSPLTRLKNLNNIQSKFKSINLAMPTKSVSQQCVGTNQCYVPMSRYVRLQYVKRYSIMLVYEKYSLQWLPRITFNIEIFLNICQMYDSVEKQCRDLETPSVRSLLNAMFYPYQITFQRVVYLPFFLLANRLKLKMELKRKINFTFEHIVECIQRYINIISLESLF